MAEPGRSRFRPVAASWRAARSSSSGMSVISRARICSRIAGRDPRAVVLLGDDLSEGPAEACQGRLCGMVLLAGPDRVLQLSAVAGEFERGQGVEGVSGCLYSRGWPWGYGGHWRLVLTGVVSGARPGQVSRGRRVNLIANMPGHRYRDLGK